MLGMRDGEEQEGAHRILGSPVGKRPSCWAVSGKSGVYIMRAMFISMLKCNNSEEEASRSGRPQGSSPASSAAGSFRTRQLHARRRCRKHANGRRNCSHRARWPGEIGEGYCLKTSSLSRFSSEAKIDLALSNFPSRCASYIFLT